MSGGRSVLGPVLAGDDDPDGRALAPVRRLVVTALIAFALLQPAWAVREGTTNEVRHSTAN
jgi:hypothetical protein